MKFAVIGDIHANIFALRAVLYKADMLGISQVYCLGDLVGYGANPNEVIDLIRQREIIVIQGNYDESVGGAAS